MFVCIHVSIIVLFIIYFFRYRFYRVANPETDVVVVVNVTYDRVELRYGYVCV